ncbi:hypothetical protein CR513_01972, partial [Mucuna pruriens]
MLFRPPDQDSFRQRDSVCILDDCKFLRLIEDKTTVHISGTPQSNEQVEATNKVILRGLRRWLDEAKGRWAEELP